MEANLGHIIFFSLVGGLFSLIGGVILLSKQKFADGLAKYATPFAAGALLAAVFFDLLPEGVASDTPKTVLTAALIGILLFFFMERFLRWFHHHHEDDVKQSKTDPRVGLIIAGDTLHNFLDGIAIAAAFLVSVPTGIVTTLAIAAHEIPQEIGDFGLLLNKGMRRRSVLLVNVFSALATVVAAVITFTIGSSHDIPTGVLLGLSAGFLLYIALSDVIPTIHMHEQSKKLITSSTLLLVAGVVTVFAAVTIAHNYIDHGDDHDHSHSHHESAHDEHEGHSDHEDEHDHHDHAH